jgi:hypothetical protein
MTMSRPKNAPQLESNDASKSEAFTHDETMAALQVAIDLFEPFGMKPTPIAWSGGAAGVIMGELHGERHAMFVHIDSEPPTDPRRALKPSPEAQDFARDLHATPHVLRFVLGPLDRVDADWRPYIESLGIERTLVGLLGAARFQYHVARSRGYARSLRGRVSVAGHLSRLGGRLSRLRLGIIRTEIQLALRLWIDDREPASEFWGYTPRSGSREIRCCPDTYELLRLSSLNGKGIFVTCSCGEPECIGIRKGFTVVHEGPLTLWKINVLKGRHIYVFDRAALRREILRGVGALVRAKSSDPGKKTIPHFGCWSLEAKLADARSHPIVDEGSPVNLVYTWIAAVSIIRDSGAA